MTIELKDGDTITFSGNSLSAWDPEGKYRAARTYRVVLVKGPNPVFKLIPIGPAVLECGSR